MTQAQGPWFRVTRDIPALTAKAGDLLRIDESTPGPIELYRVLPANRAALATARVSGALRPSGGDTAASQPRLVVLK